MSRRTGFTGSALVRLLARLTDIDASRSPGTGFADRLSQWLGWTDAISLSGGAERQSPSGAGRARGPAERRTSAEVRRRAARHWRRADRRTRPPLTRLPTSRPTAGATSPGNRRWKPAIGPLARHACAASAGGRARPSHGPAGRGGRRDGAGAGGAQEHSLLATVPGLLEKHFKRLRQAAQPAAGRARERRRADGLAGRSFRQDMQRRAAGRTGYSIATGRRAARSPSQELMPRCS